MKRFTVSNIAWETDGKKVKLPASATVVCKKEEDITDLLSDHYGWLINDLVIEREETANSADELEQAELWVANHCHEPAMEKTLFSAITALRQPVPDADEPDQALLISMATCLNHGFGMLGPQQQASMLHDMRKLWDEVQGRGYYTPANRGRYLAALKPASGSQKESRND